VVCTARAVGEWGKNLVVAKRLLNRTISNVGLFIIQAKKLFPKNFVDFIPSLLDNRKSKALI
jgi:hypothetical protein